MARRNKDSTGLNPSIRKESLAVLAKMGFGKQEPQFGPHRHHGVAARTRLSLAGKVGRLRMNYYNPVCGRETLQGQR